MTPTKMVWFTKLLLNDCDLRSLPVDESVTQSVSFLRMPKIFFLFQNIIDEMNFLPIKICSKRAFDPPIFCNSSLFTMIHLKSRIPCYLDTPLQISPRRKTKKTILGTPKSIKYRVFPANCNIKNGHNFSTRNAIQNLKIALERFGLKGFWIAHTIYLMDFGVPKMVFLVFLLGVIERGVKKDFGAHSGAQQPRIGMYWATRSSVRSFAHSLARGKVKY